MGVVLVLSSLALELSYLGMFLEVSLLEGVKNYFHWDINIFILGWSCMIYFYIGIRSGLV